MFPVVRGFSHFHYKKKYVSFMMIMFIIREKKGYFH